MEREMEPTFFPFGFFEDESERILRYSRELLPRGVLIINNSKKSENISENLKNRDKFAKIYFRKTTGQES